MKDHELWLSIAQEDLASAKHLFAVPFTTALFHIQQCAEKALKAYLVLKNGSAIKTHDLIWLTTVCIRIDKRFEILRLFVSIINPYQTAGRYPEPGFIKPNREEIEKAITQSEFILDFVIERCYFYNLQKFSKKHIPLKKRNKEELSQ